MHGKTLPNDNAWRL